MVVSLAHLYIQRFHGVKMGKKKEKETKDERKVRK